MSQYFFTAGAREKGDNRLGLRANVQRRAVFFFIRVFRKNFTQRVSDEFDGNLMLLIKLFFKGKNNQHMVDQLANSFNPLGAPSPELRADIVNHRYAQSL